jgi:hypothetical protein
MDLNRPPRSPYPKGLLLAITATLATMLLAVDVASARATASIEGVWSFNGGQIAVQGSSNGTFVGTVVVQTKFAECTHPVGQQIWTKLTLLPDGSYWGFHQWYLGTSSCVLNPTLGPTAWRVLEAPGGSRYLRVCFSHPGTSQPTIAANGSDGRATYGCVNSALTAPLPQVSGTAGYSESLSVPSAKKCLSLRLFKIHLLDPKYDPLRRVSVTIRGRRVAVARKGKYIVASVDLRGLPPGAFTVKIHATTTLGHSLSATRTYHTCVKKNASSSNKRSSKKGLSGQSR